jgi:DNA-binding cell septation regulator SpoVG
LIILSKTINFGYKIGVICNLVLSKTPPDAYHKKEPLVALKPCFFAEGIKIIEREQELFQNMEKKKRQKTKNVMRGCKKR